MKQLATWMVAVTLVLGVGAAVGGGGNGVHSASGPLASMTGAPAIGGSPEEGDCTLCHQDYANPCDPPCNLNSPGGGVEILDLPADYLPGTPVPMRVRMWTDSTLAYENRKWGFQVTAVRESDGAGVGTWIVPPDDTLQVSPGSAPFDTRSYTEQGYLGTRTGLAGPVEWSFTWDPPAGNEGRVIFCVAGNATNGNEEPGPGDFVFTALDTLAPNAVPVRAASWGGVKARWR